MSSKLSKRIIAVLNLPTAVSDFIIRIQAIVLAMKASPYFSGLNNRLIKLETLNQDLINAETAVKTTPPNTSIEVRNAQWELVRTHIRIIRNEVQNIADEDPANAAIIITSAAMDIKNEATHPKKKNTAKNGTEPLSVILTGEGAGAHEWRMSYDEIVWINLPSTKKATTIVRNLKYDTICYFQNKLILTNEEPAPWSDSVKIRIK